MSAILGPDGTPLSTNTEPTLLGSNGNPINIEAFAEYTPEEMREFLVFLEGFLQQSYGLENVIAISLGELARMARTMQMAFPAPDADGYPPEENLEVVQAEEDESSAQGGWPMPAMLTRPSPAGGE